jgi:hypothetical protein
MKISLSLYMVHLGSGSRDSSVGMPTDYELDGYGSISGRVKIFLFSTMFRPDLGPTQRPIQWVPGVNPQGCFSPENFETSLFQNGCLAFRTHAKMDFRLKFKRSAMSAAIQARPGYT